MKELTKSREQLEVTGLSNKEKQQLEERQSQGFEELKKEASKNDDVIEKIEKFYYGLW